MILQLSYDAHTRHDTCAAFIRGNSPEQWFHEMNNWQIPLEDLICLLLPAYKGAVHPGGIIVLFKDKIPAPDTITHPYTMISSKLLIPVNATLLPALHPEETAQLLIWHWQVLHPGIGFTGFEQRDELHPGDLLAFTPVLATNWHQAHPGLPAMAGLKSIRIPPPPQNDLLSLLDNVVENEPLSALPGPKPRNTRLEQLTDKLTDVGLRALLSLMKSVDKSSSRPTRTALSPGMNKSSKTPGKLHRFLDKLRQRMEKKVGDITSRRESALDRLINLFDKDSEEALKYAIPVNSHYEGRGTPPPSSQLSQQDPHFSLGGLQGGKPVDTWIMADHYTNSLTAKYREEASKAIAAGNYKKAAYIYAHLLGNFTEAAAALEKGKFYREAAALYKDHLKQPVIAAQCLEKGGLLLEAIDIYKQLEYYEKTGDLLQLLTQQEAAEKYFRLSVDAALQKHDYLDAARILNNKAGYPDEARIILLQGWNAGQQAQACLTTYFYNIKNNQEEKLPEHIRQVYEQQVPTVRRSEFLQVLVSVYPHINEAAQQVSTDITYETISAQAAMGDHSNMALLKQLLPEDKLLPVDINRFTTILQPKKAP
jgi:tetratricopeptide (TPR) repeat protein